MLIALAVALPPHDCRAQLQPDEHTLFLAHFDKGLKADFAKGKPEAQGQGEITLGQEGRFGEAVRLTGRQTLSFAGPGNLDPTRGTLEFWFCPETDPFQPFRIFSFRSAPHSYLNINLIPESRLGAAICGGTEEAWVYRRRDCHVTDWKQGEWHHLAVTWEPGTFAFYVDGKLAAPPATGVKPVKVPERFSFLAAPGVIDEVRISSVVRSPMEIRAAAAPASGGRLVARPAFLTDNPPMKQTGVIAGIDHRTVHGELPVPVAIAGRFFDRGVAVTGSASVTFPVPTGFDRLVTTVGTSEFAGRRGRLVFVVSGGVRELYRSEPVTQMTPPQRVIVPLEGVKQVTLSVDDRSASVSTRTPPSREAWADWGELVLLRPGQKPSPPRSRPLAEWERTVARLKLSAYDLSAPPTSAQPGYAVLPWSPLDDFDPQDPHPPWRNTVLLKTFATPGEYEPMSFVVGAFRGLARVRLETAGLRGTGGVIPKDRFDVRWVMRCPVRKLYTLKAEDSVVVSRFLLHKPRVDMEAKSFRQVYVIVHVPDDAAPGRYEGRWTLRCDNAPATQIAVQLEVLPFKLVAPGNRVFGVYYRFGKFPDDLARMDRELRDIRAHGATTLVPNLGVRYVQAEGRIVPDFSNLVAGLELMRRHGFHGPLPLNTGLVQLSRMLKVEPGKDNADAEQRQFEETGKAALTGLVQLNKRFPEFEFLATHMDEVLGRGRLPLYVYLTRVVRLVPKLRTYITMHNTPRAGVEEMTRRIDPYVDVRCYNGHALDDWLRAGHTFVQFNDELTKAGDEAWIYYNIRGAFFRPQWTRLVNSYYLWMSPLRAHVPWMYYAVHGNPLDDTDGPRARGHDFGYAVPSPYDGNELIPTLDWEAYREGIDDLRYLALLESLSKKAQANAPDAAVSAQAWLRRLRGFLPNLPADVRDIEGESPVLIWFSRKYTDADYQRWRRRTAAEITRLRQAPGD